MPLAIQYTGNRRKSKFNHYSSTPEPDSQSTELHESLYLLHGQIGNRAVTQLIQAKLWSGKPDDRYEQQADQYADQILDAQNYDSAIPGVQPKKTNGGGDAIDSAVAGEIDGLQGRGILLAPSLRRFFEPRFGRDFSHVRTHKDAAAARIAQTLNAKAFTCGRDIVFNTNQYRPDHPAGRQLLAHELTHVVQQDQGDTVPTLQRRTDPGAPVAPAGATPRPAGAPVPAVVRPSPDERTRHNVTVVDFGQNANIYNWREVITHIGEIEAETVDQMVVDVIAEVGDPATDCISRLTLVGHGTPGNISVGAGTGWMAEGSISTGNFRPSIARLTPYFCDGATVVLYACNVGRGPTGATFIQTLADFWQVNVAAPTGAVNGFGIMGVWVWGQPGQVLPNDTDLIVDQIVRILDETTYGDDEEMIFDLLEAGDNRGLLPGIQAELVRQGRWDRLSEDLRDEDEDRYNQIFP